MNLNFPLSSENEQCAIQAVGHRIHYCVPADLSFVGYMTEGYFVIGEEKWAYIEHGEIRESAYIHEARDYNLVPLVGNACLEAVIHGEKHLIVRVSMKHVARYAYIAQILNYMATNSKIRIYNEEPEAICIQCGGPLIAGTRVCPQCMSKVEAMRRLIQVCRSYWKILTFSMIILLSTLLISLTGPFLHRVLVNSVLKPAEGQPPDMNLFVLVIAGLVLGLVFGEVLGIVRGRIMAAVSSDIAADLRKLVYEKIQNLSLGFLTTQRAGDMMNRVTNDTDRIRQLIQEFFTTAIYQIVMLSAVSILLLATDWRLALIIILPAPLVAYMQVFMWRYVLRRLFHKQWRIYDRANSFLHDVLSGIRVVKSFGKEEREITRFRQYNSDYAQATYQSEKVFSILWPMSNYFIQIGLYLVLLLGCHMIVNGTLSIGELVQFTGYATMIYGPLMWLMYMPRSIANALISIDRVFSIIDEQPEIYDTVTSITHSIKGDISFHDVTFGYKSYEPILKQINLDIKQGEMIGLVGHSGAGKSTLINLVSRFYDVNEGEIRIDGVDIRQIKQEDLREQIGVVLQETFLFSGTILENIIYSKPTAQMEEVIQAAKIANAHDFIVALPDGYDTRLEENGNNLSGGERQRLAIARAILNNPRILILDEATASLDIDTETAIQEALQRVTKHRTTLAIAHRLSTLRHADRLVVLEKGEIAEIGSHDELMAREGIYYNLIMAQRNMQKVKERKAEDAEIIA